MDSDKREYLPAGITEVLSSFDFIERGYNLCILGESDAGKSYLAKAIGIKACNRYNVGYFHSEELLESMVALKEQDYDKRERNVLLPITGEQVQNYKNFILTGETYKPYKYY